MNDPKRCFLLSIPSGRGNTTDKSTSEELGGPGESFLSFFQQSESVCVLSKYSTGKVTWSSAIPGSIGSVGLSHDRKRLAACVRDRCYVSSLSEGFNLDFFPLPQSTGSLQASCVRFSPSNSDIVAVSTARDVRVLDLTRSLAKPDSLKSLFTISGAAAQATPASFTFIDSNVILTGWDLAPSPYLRLVDLREGSNKSIKIWKSKSIRGLSASSLEPHLVAGHGGGQTCVWDIRRCESVSSFDSSDVLSLDWSACKRNTLGLLSDSGLSVRRLDLNREYQIGTGGVTAGAFTFSSSNDLVIVDAFDGSVKSCNNKNFPIPVISGRSGRLFSVSSTGCSQVDGAGSQALFAEVAAVAARMTDDTSLVDSVTSEEIDFVLPEHVHLETVAERLSLLFDSDEILKSSPTPFGIASHHSPARAAALQLLLSEKERTSIMPIIQGDWPGVLRTLAESPVDVSLLRSVSSLLIAAPPINTFLRLKSDNCALQIACDFVNMILDENEQNRLDRIRHFVQHQTDVDLFFRAVVAVTFFPTRQEVSSAISAIVATDESPKSLRHVVLTGFSDAAAVDAIVSSYLQSSKGSVLNVALLGLLLAGPRIKSLPPVFVRCASFIRDQVCNRLGGDCWRLRSVIDSLLSESGPGSARLVCYYCNKAVLGGEGTRCPQRGCHKPLPSCCVCLEPLRLTSEPDEWIVWCSTCRHGGHSRHVRDWFAAFDECPVAGCACQCAAIDGL